MNATLTLNSPARQRGRRLVSLLVAVLVASFAFGVGLPWIVADAPPAADELWARSPERPGPAAFEAPGPRRGAEGRAVRPGMSALDAPTQIVLRGNRHHAQPDARRATPVAATAPVRPVPRDAVAAAAAVPSPPGAAAGQRPGATARDREIPLKRIALVLGAVALAGTLVLAVSLAMASDATYSSTRSMPPAFAFAT